MHQKLLDSMLARSFYKGWTTPPNDRENLWPSIEFIVNGKCDQKCKYCYIANYGNELFPEGTEDDQKILDNAAMMMVWLKKNNFKPNIELFSAELFSQEIGFQLLDLIHQAGWDGMRVVVPSNFNFLFDDEKIKRLDSLRKKFTDRQGWLSLSCSVDGKFMEDNRPIIDGRIRDDAFYDKMFSMSKLLYHGFHPMVYSEGIEKWKDNFLWFQENFKKHDIPYNNIYLLEVRNKEWSEEQCRQLGSFVEFLVEWLRDKFTDDMDFINAFFRPDQGFNMLNSPFTFTRRGMVCSVQSTFIVRLGDLTVWPCHRTMYPELKLAEMEVHKNEIVKPKVVNFPLYLATKFATLRNFPYCATCIMKRFCPGGCYGAQYETAGDMFTPIPTMCMMEHAKIISIFRALKYKTNVWERIKSRVMLRKLFAIQNLEKNGLI